VCVFLVTSPENDSWRPSLAGSAEDAVLTLLSKFMGSSVKKRSII